MKVLLTGGTGFVGSHTAAALREAGHDVRLLVRSRARVPAALGPLGIDSSELEIVTGDVTDRGAVARSLEGCDAVIHAASVYTLNPRRDAEIRETNVAGTETVIGLAVEAELDPIVHVSSLAAMVDRDGVLTPDTSPGTPPGAYYRSKADSDRMARTYQGQGAPVVITYPPSIWGPHDPHLGESSRGAISLLRGAYRFAVRGGLVVCDVRDVARLHSAVLEPGRGPRRYLVPSQRIEVPALVRRFASLTGRRIRTTELPPFLALPAMKAIDALQRLLPFRVPLNFQIAYLISRYPSWGGWDDSATREAFAMEGRSLDEMFGDTIRWLYRKGHLSARLAGRLAEDPQGPYEGARP